MQEEGEQETGLARLFGPEGFVDGAPCSGSAAEGTPCTCTGGLQSPPCTSEPLLLVKVEVTV